MGERVDYPVPDPEGTFVAGCARLGISGERVEFNVEREEPIGKQSIFCIWVGKGAQSSGCPNADGPGFFIRGRLVPRPESLGHGYFVWGTGPADADPTQVTWSGGTADAAVFSIDREFGMRFGAQVPFSIFVVELPKEAACSSITVEAPDGQSIEKGPFERVCERVTP